MLTRKHGKLEGTEFEIESSYKGNEVHLVERAGFSFECHARAAIILACMCGEKVSWVHNNVVMDTTKGGTIEELQTYYNSQKSFLD